jgi:hypothetical protein
LRRRIRQMYLKRWKQVKTRYENLIESNTPGKAGGLPILIRNTQRASMVMGEHPERLLAYSG